MIKQELVDAYQELYDYLTDTIGLDWPAAHDFVAALDQDRADDLSMMLTHIAQLEQPTKRRPAPPPLDVTAPDPFAPALLRRQAD